MIRYFKMIGRKIDENNKPVTTKIYDTLFICSLVAVLFAGVILYFFTI